MKRTIVAILATCMAFTLTVCTAQVETPDNALIQQIGAYFAMPKDQLIATLGPGYEVAPAGPEGVCDGYFYEELGLTFAFYPDEDELEMIDCDEPFKLNGVGAGNLFAEITAALGDNEIQETWIELPEYTAFMLEYQWGEIVYVFIAFDADRPVDSFWIYQRPEP